MLDRTDAPVGRLCLHPGSASVAERATWLGARWEARPGRGPREVVVHLWVDTLLERGYRHLFAVPREHVLTLVVVGDDALVLLQEDGLWLSLRREAP